MATTRIVILGGGIGGQVAATRLQQRLRGKAKVTVIERSPEYVFAPSLLWLMVGKRSPRAITRDYSALEQRGVEVRYASVTGIDTSTQTVHTDAGPEGYDYLIVALGARMDSAAVPGVAEHTHHPYDLASAERLREALGTFGGGRVVVAIHSLPYRCPAAPYETAMLIDGYLRAAGLRDRSSVEVHTPEPLPLPVAGPHAGHAVAAELARRSIAFKPGRRLAGAEPGRLHFEDGVVDSDLAVVIPPHRPPESIAGSGLGGAGGWIPVDRATLRARPGNVYAIGDIASIPLENGMLLPKAGVFAHGEAEVVAENVSRRILGRLDEVEWDGHGTCFLETGDGKAGMASGDFYASPAPEVNFRRPSRLWHLGKVAFEQYWLRRWL
ncbi:MAG: FAD/NAD(P)-binding oxidoreductase [Dehalococcoidia bacterium]